MQKQLTRKDANRPVFVYRSAYGLFLLLVIWYLFKGDFGNATTNMGIALIFDPFDTTIPLQNRSHYQRVWLTLHLAITCAGFLYMILN